MILVNLTIKFIGIMKYGFISSWISLNLETGLELIYHYLYAQVVSAEKASRGGLNEKLTMTVAVPLLWGVPPASETLHLAVQSGGGIVEKVYWQWDFL